MDCLVQGEKCAIRVPGSSSRLQGLIYPDALAVYGRHCHRSLQDIGVCDDAQEPPSVRRPRDAVAGGGALGIVDGQWTDSAPSAAGIRSSTSSDAETSLRGLRSMRDPIRGLCLWEDATSIGERYLTNRNTGMNIGRWLMSSSIYSEGTLQIEAVRRILSCASQFIIG